MRLMASVLAAALAMGSGAQAQTFDGAYAGAEFGFARGDADFRITDDGIGSATDSFRYRGAEGGLFAGYRYQFPNNVVIGGEVAGLISGADGYRGRLFDDFFGGFDLRADVEKRREISISAKPGFVVQPDTMVYLIGGFQRSRFRVRQTFAGDTTTDNTSRDGYHLGAGLEHAPLPNISVRLEYRYQDYGRIVFREPGERLSFEPDENVLRAGVAYRF